MKNVILLFSLLAFIVGSTIAQNDEYTDYDTASATYAGPTIGVDGDFDSYGDVSACAVTHTVTFPGNAIAMYVDVEYNIISDSLAGMSYQRSQLWCTAPGGTNEPEVYNGSGSSLDTMSYSRTGLDIAYGIVGFWLGGEIDFELHTGSTHWAVPNGMCTTDYNYVEDGSYTVSLIYLPVGSPGLASNPSPADEILLVGLEDDLTWDMGGQTSYKVYFGDTYPPVYQDSIVSSAATGIYDPGTLTANTEYFWQIVTVNAVNQSPGPVWSFKTECDAPVYPSFEGFEAYTAPQLPDCWVGLTNGFAFSTVETVYGTYNSHTGSMAIAFKSGDIPYTDDSLFLVLPKVGNVSDYMVQFWAKNALDFGPWSSTLYEFPYTIGTMSDPFDYTTFEAFQTYIPGEFYEPCEAFFKNIVTTDEYIAILAEPDFGQWLNIDDVTVDLLPSCIKPLDVMADEVLAEQATISWTELNDPVAGAYNIAYNDGTNFDTLWGVATNPYTITGLTSAEYYDIYVQTDCGSGDESDWSWPLSIITECLPFAVPFFEDFGEPVPYPGVYLPPLCWEVIDIHGGQFGGIGFEQNNAYTGMGIWMSPEGDAAAELIISSPEVSVGINTLRTTFWAKTSSSTQDSLIIVGTISDPFDETTFTPYDTIDGLTQDFELYKVYFNNYVGTDVHIAWRHNSAEHPQAQVYLDDITVETIPACVEPYKAYLGDVTDMTAWIHWTDPVETATDWEVQVGLIGFHPDSATAPTNTYTHNDAAGLMQSFNMHSLNAGTVYDAYVRTDCGGSNSIWEGPVTLQTNFSSLALPYSEGFETGFGTTLNDFNNTFDWALDDVLTHSGDSSIWADPPVDNKLTATLAVAGIFDLTAKADQMLTFWHIPKTDGNYAHCYVEISTDGGVTFAPLPESTYFGGGNYYLPTSGTPIAGPAFDEDSYPEYGTGNETPDNTWWRKEYFNLSDYSAFDNVVFRFRLQEYYTNKAGWWIDDIAIEDLGTTVDFSVSPLTISEDVYPSIPIATDIVTANAGDIPTTYTASVVYDEVKLIDETFNAGIPGTWTIIDGGNTTDTWVDTTDRSGASFDGTRFAFADSYLNYGAIENTHDEQLITPVVDASAYIGATLSLEFDQAFDVGYQSDDTARVSVYDGADWVVIYESWTDDGYINYNSNGIHKVYDVSAYANANFQVKFHYIEASITRRGYYFALDNVKLRGSNFAIGWLTTDGAESTGGVTMPDADMLTSLINVNMDATGLAAGTYMADVEVASADPGFTTTLIPVTMTVLPEVAIDMTVFLEGPYDAVTGSVMMTDLLTGGYLPLAQPYNPALPYYDNAAPVWLYAGTETVTAVPANTVDWVLVELRDAADAASAGSATAIATQAAFLLNDGSVVGLDGNRLIFFDIAVAQNLFVVIYHRNHLAVMSANAVTATGGIYNYDFSSAETQVYGGANGHKDLGAGVWGMVAGDGTANGLVQLDDAQGPATDDLGLSGYLGGDYDLNTLGQLSDKQEVWLPNLGTGGQIPAKGATVIGYSSQVPK